jgi:hypothetical protein
MNINLNSMEFFTFSWFDISLDSIEKYFLSNDFEYFDILKNQNENIEIEFEYNPKTFVSNFMQKNNGVIMLPNLRDGWVTLFHKITVDLKINGYHFKLSSDKEPFNFIEYLENGIKKRICYTLKDDDKWVFYESGTPLFFEETENYKTKIKKNRLNKEIMLKYCGKLNIIKENILEINNEKNNLRAMYKNIK